MVKFHSEKDIVKEVNLTLRSIALNKDAKDTWLYIRNSGKYDDNSYEKAKAQEELLEEYSNGFFKSIKRSLYDDRDHNIDSVLGDLVHSNPNGSYYFFDLKVGENKEQCGLVTPNSYHNFIDEGIYIFINSHFTRWYVIRKRDICELDEPLKHGCILEKAEFGGYELLKGKKGVIYTEL